MITQTATSAPSDIAEDELLERSIYQWATEFDAKLDTLAARQDGFLKYLELRQTELEKPR